MCGRDRGKVLMEACKCLKSVGEVQIILNFQMMEVLLRTHLNLCRKFVIKVKA